ncbi:MULTISPECIES: hypothetical protein [Brevibacillus]|uniref:DNA alkylation repair protein n=1 Tax=Brevibacillus laterosporus LMG 15441 TaxID=1042163 RepID=A0A075R8L7_BRELA|nr:MULTISPECIES: hypothetical protein [Brevibacillus]AIG25900.1 hypothetical protein BRLA_c015760 [Brevibacillus laterosporus LMG 15441]AUM64526.1 hypothetical protein C0R09_08305 [Brevibacillus laterosporus]AYK07420.1 hypothetical protein D8Z77_14155 [Brevibacillus laterosporus]ERM18538.1 hypothetical protein P615_15975 [Brevibacillus laterosporus PE36]MBA4533491.1 hypothetical protein [Brevibacillus halotolerans]
MSAPYCCPVCRTNRMRFTIIRQQPQYVRLHPQTGETVEELTQTELDAFHQPYKGDDYLVQCGICGTIESEERFVKMAQHSFGPK